MLSGRGEHVAHDSDTSFVWSLPSSKQMLCKLNFNIPTSKRWCRPSEVLSSKLNAPLDGRSHTKMLCKLKFNIPTSKRWCRPSEVLSSKLNAPLDGRSHIKMLCKLNFNIPTSKMWCRPTEVLSSKLNAPLDGLHAMKLCTQMLCKLNFNIPTSKMWCRLSEVLSSKLNAPLDGLPAMKLCTQMLCKLNFNIPTSKMWCRPSEVLSSKLNAPLDGRSHIKGPCILNFNIQRQKGGVGRQSEQVWGSPPDSILMAYPLKKHHFLLFSSSFSRLWNSTGRGEHVAHDSDTSFVWSLPSSKQVLVVEGFFSKEMRWW
ncbi:hypothetical protein J6590_075587, partial [Homalodisca vitripennis]